MSERVAKNEAWSLQAAVQIIIFYYLTVLFSVGGFFYTDTLNILPCVVFTNSGLLVVLGVSGGLPSTFFNYL